MFLAKKTLSVLGVNTHEYDKQLNKYLGSDRVYEKDKKVVQYILSNWDSLQSDVAVGIDSQLDSNLRDRFYVYNKRIVKRIKNKKAIQREQKLFIPVRDIISNHEEFYIEKSLSSNTKEVNWSDLASQFNALSAMLEDATCKNKPLIKNIIKNWEGIVLRGEGKGTNVGLKDIYVQRAFFDPVLGRVLVDTSDDPHYGTFKVCRKVVDLVNGQEYARLTTLACEKNKYKHFSKYMPGRQEIAPLSICKKETAISRILFQAYSFLYPNTHIPFITTYGSSSYKGRVNYTEHLKYYWHIPYCSYGDLYEVVEASQTKKEEDKIPKEKSLKLIQQLVYAVYFMEYHGFTHNDIKLENVFLINQDYDCVLGDYGLSEKIKNNKKTEGGTLNYIGPSWFCDNDKKHPWASSGDRWALGCIAYILIHGYGDCVPPWFNMDYSQFQYYMENLTVSDALDLIEEMHSTLSDDPVYKNPIAICAAMLWISKGHETLASILGEWEKYMNISDDEEKVQWLKCKWDSYKEIS